MKEKDREPAESGPRRQETGDRETGRGRSPEDPTAAWDPDRTLPAPGATPGPAPPAPASELSPGDTFGSYRLEAPLGRGGFGEVWEAVHSESGRRVALKLLTSQGETTPEARERFHREARLAASVRHPHCVFLFGAEEVDGRMAVAMEIMEGGTLQDVLDAEGRLPYRPAVDAVLDLVDGLEAAEKKGIIHRDIKPSNCFLDASGGVKIGDFGLSKTLEADDALTVTGTYLGTPAYSSPEQVRGREIDFRSDVFSLGALLYHLVTGELPFGSGPATHVLGRILFEDPKSPSEHDVEVPKGLEKVIRRMMAKEPGERFASYDALRRALAALGSRGLTPAPLPKRLGAFLIDLPVLISASFAVAALAGEIAVWRGSATEWSLQSGGAVEAATIATYFLYFFLLEGHSASSLGKRVVGLAVQSAAGHAAGWLQILIRTTVFLGILALPDFLVEPGSPLNSLAWVAAVIAILAPMSKRNGYAGLHGLVSRTRVCSSSTPSEEMAPAGEDLVAIYTGPDAVGRRFGQYEAVHWVWTQEGERLCEALDPLLHRRVWVHVRESDPDQEKSWDLPSPHNPQPGNLRWLQAGRVGELRWSAYERPEGLPLLAWAAGHGSEDWRQVLIVLRSLADALSHAGRSLYWSLAHIWVEPGGQVRLLPFPWPLQGKGDQDDAGRPKSWQGLLSGATRVLLEGRLPAGADGRPSVPLPRSVRSSLEQIEGGGFGTIQEAASELEHLLDRTTPLSHLQRVASLAPVTFLAVCLGAMGVILAFEERERVSPRREIPERLEQWHGLGDGARRDVEVRREALAALLAHGYLEANSPETVEAYLGEVRSSGGLQRIIGDYFYLMATGSLSISAKALGLPWGVSKEDERLLGELAATRGLLDPDELAALRRLAGPTRAALWYLNTASLLFNLALLSVGGLVAAVILRGGLGLRLALVHVQRWDGRPAGRSRCALRAAIAWLPALIPQAAAPLFGDQHPATLSLALTAPLILLAGTLYAVWHPTRGLQDRLAGTWLMPR